MGHDWWTRGRIHRASWLAVGVLVLDDGLAFVRPSGGWTGLTAGTAADLESVLLPLM